MREDILRHIHVPDQRRLRGTKCSRHLVEPRGSSPSIHHKKTRYRGFLLLAVREDILRHIHVPDHRRLRGTKCSRHLVEPREFSPSIQHKKTRYRGFLLLAVREDILRHIHVPDHRRLRGTKCSRHLVEPRGFSPSIHHKKTRYRGFLLLAVREDILRHIHVPDHRRLRGTKCSRHLVEPRGFSPSIQHKKTRYRGFLLFLLLAVREDILRHIHVPDHRRLRGTKCSRHFVEPRGSSPSIHHKKTRYRGFLLLAVREGFEPSMPFDIHTFQACSFGHSDTSPLVKKDAQYYTNLLKTQEITY